MRFSAQWQLVSLYGRVSGRWFSATTAGDWILRLELVGVDEACPGGVAPLPDAGLPIHLRMCMPPPRDANTPIGPRDAGVPEDDMAVPVADRRRQNRGPVVINSTASKRSPSSSGFCPSVAGADQKSLSMVAASPEWADLAEVSRARSSLRYSGSI